MKLLAVPTVELTGIRRTSIGKDGVVDPLAACEAIRDYGESHLDCVFDVLDDHGDPVSISCGSALEMLQGRALLLVESRQRNHYELRMPEFDY